MKKFFSWAAHNRMPAVIFGSGLLSTFLTLCFTGYFYRLYLMNSYGGEAVDHNTIYFAIQGAEQLDLCVLQQGELVHDATLLLHSPSSGMEYYILYTEGKKDIFGGKYFADWDFDSGNPVCVLGQYAVKRYGNVTAMLENGEYPVKAVLDETIISGINSAVFYTDSMLSAVPVAGRILALASTEKAALYVSFGRLEEYFADAGFAVKEITFSRVTLQAFLGYNEGFLLALGGYLLFLLVIHVVLLIYWYHHKKMWQRVMQLFGQAHTEVRAALHFCSILAAADIVGGILYLAATDSINLFRTAFVLGIGMLFIVQAAAVLLYGGVKFLCRSLNKSI